MILTLLPALALLITPAGDPLPFPLESMGNEVITSIDGQETRTELLSVNHGTLDLLSEREFAVLTNCPLPSGDLVSLDLQRLPISSATSLLFVDGAPTEKVLGEGITLWSGSVLGQPNSDVFLSFSEAGTRGWLRTGGEDPSLTHWIAEAGPGGDWSTSIVRMMSEEQLGLSRALGCLLDDMPDGGRVPGLAPPTAVSAAGQASTQAGASQGRGSSSGKIEGTFTPLRDLPVAVETDYDFFQLFGDVTAAETYAVSLMGAISARFREQFDVVVTLPYLGLYTTAADPWTSQDSGGTSIDLLYEFQSAWYANMPVDAALGHFLSGASLGGGVAWLDVLCMPEYRFGVTGNLGGVTPFPVVQGPLNWDFVAGAHELGHNLSTLHTHDYCPPLDECAPSGYFGACQTQEVCTTTGTLMSYCHLCGGGGSNITTYFHPTVVQTIAARVENSCLQPFEGLFSSPLGGGQAGAGGVPTITASYDSGPHQLTVNFGNVPSPETGFLVVGGSQISTPLFGGTLIPSPDIVKVFPVGSSSVTLPPADFSSASYPTGINLYMQGWFTDSTSASTFATTNAIATELIVPMAPPVLTWLAHPSNGKQYALTPPGVWSKGEALAQEYGGHTVSMEDPAEELWLKNAFFTSGLVSGNVYIGLTDEDVEGSFQWSSGTASSHSNWASGEPNNYNGSEDYTTWAGGQWNDVNGSTDYPSLIQKP
jgi:hypothetical protein